MSIAKPARLWLKPAERGREAVWIIKDAAAGRRIGTGCGERDVAGAQRKLEQYLAATRNPEKRRSGDPGEVPLADILNCYAQGKAKTVARPRELTQRAAALLDFFGRMTLANLAAKSPEAVRDDYVERRGSSMARRELEDLRAAIGAYFERDENRQTAIRLPRIALPPKPQARTRWLTRSEAAKLIWAAWRFRETQRGATTDRASRQHVARFILVGLYTGSRSGAICNAALTEAIGRGYVDLDKGLFYRRGLGDAETKKRQPTVSIPERLLTHMRRWRRLRISNQAVVEYQAQPVKSVRKAFARAAADAGLKDVTPHILRHTAVSWAVQNGVDLYRIADFFGMTPAMILGVYGHLRPDNVVGDAITGRTRKRGGQ
jgi:integrase